MPAILSQAINKVNADDFIDEDIKGAKGFLVNGLLLTTDHEAAKLLPKNAFKDMVIIIDAFSWVKCRGYTIPIRYADKEGSLVGTVTISVNGLWVKNKSMEGSFDWFIDVNMSSEEEGNEFLTPSKSPICYGCLHGIERAVSLH